MRRAVRCAFYGALCAWIVGSLAAAGRADDGPWLTNFEAAKAKAKAEKKLVFALFTGSDWCIFCKRLHSEILDKEAFLTQAPKAFVLLELDYPRTKKLPDELKSQNAKLQAQYKIHGFPTVLLLDTDGHPVAKTGYRPGSAEDYVGNLKELVTTYEKIVALTTKAGKLKGLNRAKMLDEIVTSSDKLGLENGALAKYGDEIIKLDTANRAGLKAKYTFRKLVAEADQLRDAKKIAEAQAAYDKAVALPGITGEQKQDVYFSQSQCFFLQRDFVGVVDHLKKAEQAAPESAKAERIKSMLTRYAPLAEAQTELADLDRRLAKTEGLERAKVLDQMVEARTKLDQGRPSPEIEKWAQEIVTLDPANKAGLKAKYEFRTLLAEATKYVRTKDDAQARTALEKAQSLSGLTDAQKAQIERMLKSLPDPKPAK